MDQLAEHLKSMTPLQRAVFALKETQARLEALEQKRAEPMAIVGMACRFPGGASDPLSYWRLLRDGVDAVGEIPPDRWNADDFYDPDPAAPGKMNTRSGGFLERIDEFDNHFFGISDREAARIDPQQRILLEVAWEALEDAGLPPATLRGSKTGVFVGISVSEYGMMLSGDLSQTDAHAATGTSLCLAANRLSFAFGWQGPSVALDTACSSSLVAVHLACQSIRNGECEAALAGGVSLLLSPVASVNLTKAGFCASDGRVRAFDAAASGYVRSEGAGLVVLKPLAAALKDKDPVYAVIRGSAVNQNGSCNGLTAPSRAAQEQVLREAYARAQVSPGRVQFVETQGTGTPLGDAIEALALGHVLREDRPPDSPCAIGAVKTNIGHLEAASGIAGLIKTALALQHRQLPPNLHFQTPNPDIPFAELPLRVPQRLESWPDATQGRLAGVSAFGFGGSNAHVVLEEPPPDAADATDAELIGHRRRLCLLPLSARTERALHALAQRYGEFLRGDPPPWCDICHTAAQRRDHHDCRLAVLADSHQQAAELLSGFVGGQAQPGVFVGRKPYGHALKIAFVYSGDAERWKPYRLQSAEFAPGFAAALGEIDAILQHVAGWPLESVLREEARWDDPAYAWPALLTLQLGLAAWWRSGKIGPDVVLGQGVGELAAACAAGILTAEEALRIAVACGRGKDLAPPNGRQHRRASLPFLSALDGQVHAGPDLHAAHWRCCMGRGEGLAAAVSALSQRRVDVCLEIGPASLIEVDRQVDHSWLAVPALFGAGAGGVDVLTAVGRLYAAGADFLWGRLAPTGGRHVRVPTYPWQRQRLWVHAKNRLVMAPAADTQPDKPEAESPAGDGWAQLQRAAMEPAAAAELRLRPELTSPYVAPRTKLEEALAEAWSAIIRIDRIGIHDNFFELGGDSLQATILLNRLQEQLGGAVPGHVLFQVQTVHDLAAYLWCHCPDAVRRRYPEEALAGSEELVSPEAMAVGAEESPSGKEAAAPANVPSISRAARDDQAEQLLARLDELSDDEVQSLLEGATADQEATHE